MKVLLIPVLDKPRIISISNLEDMQQTVGGLITAHYPWEEKACIVLNDNGIAEGLVPNRFVFETGNIIFGDFFIAGLDEEEFCSLPDDLIKKYSRRFAAPEVIMFTEKGFTVTQFYGEDMLL